MKIPCIDCLLVPVCTHKWYSKLRRECAIVENYISNCTFEERKDSLKNLVVVLGATMWEIGEETEHGYWIVQKDYDEHERTLY